MTHAQLSFRQKVSLMWEWLELWLQNSAICVYNIDLIWMSMRHGSDTVGTLNELDYWSAEYLEKCWRSDEVYENKYVPSGIFAVRNIN